MVFRYNGVKMIKFKYENELNLEIENYFETFEFLNLKFLKCL